MMLNMEQNEEIKICPWRFTRESFEQVLRLCLAIWGDDSDDAASILCESVWIAAYLRHTSAGYVAMVGNAIVGICLVGRITNGRLPDNQVWRERQEHMEALIRSLHWGDRDVADTLRRLAEENEFAHDIIRSHVRPEAEVHLLVTGKAWQGMGIGRALLTRACEASCRRGIRRMFLVTDTYCDWQFYEHLGLSRVATRPSAIAPDYLRMAYAFTPSMLLDCKEKNILPTTWD